MRAAWDEDGTHYLLNGTFGALQSEKKKHKDLSRGDLEVAFTLVAGPDTRRFRGTMDVLRSEMRGYCSAPG